MYITRDTFSIWKNTVVKYTKWIYHRNAYTQAMCQRSQFHFRTLNLISVPIWVIITKIWKWGSSGLINRTVVNLRFRSIILIICRVKRQFSKIYKLILFFWQPEKKNPSLTPMDWVKFFVSGVVGLVSLLAHNLCTNLQNAKRNFACLATSIFFIRCICPIFVLIFLYRKVEI